MKRDAEHAAVMVQAEGMFRLAQTPGEYLSLPTGMENEEHVAAFINRTSNNALSEATQGGYQGQTTTPRL